MLEFDKDMFKFGSYKVKDEFWDDAIYYDWFYEEVKTLEEPGLTVTMFTLLELMIVICWGIYELFKLLLLLKFTIIEFELFSKELALFEETFGCCKL